MQVGGPTSALLDLQPCLRLPGNSAPVGREVLKPLGEVCGVRNLEGRSASLAEELRNDW